MKKIVEGVFEKRRGTEIFCWIGLIFGMALILAFPYLLLSGAEVTLDSKVISGFFCFIGVCYFILCNVILFMKHKVKITVDEKGITAFCNFGFKLDCPFSLVAEAFSLNKVLTVRLKNGKRYKLLHLENAPKLAKLIRERIVSDGMPEESVEALSHEIACLNRKKLPYGIGAIASFIAMFGAFIAAPAVVGWRELNEFSAVDWQRFGIVCVTLPVFIGLLVLFLCKYAVKSDVVEDVKRRLNRYLLLKTPPTVPGAVDVYVNDEYSPRFRAVVYRGVGDRAYFSIEAVGKNYEIETVEEAVEYESMEELVSDLKNGEWGKIKKTWYGDD